MKTQSTFLAAFLASLVLVASSARAELLFSYDFNTPETSATSSGTAHIGAAGTGLSGAPADKALDNTAATMSGAGGGAYYEGTLGTLASFTVTMWFKTDGMQTKGATRLFDNGTQLLAFDGADSSGSQKLTFNSGTSLGTYSTSTLATSGEWIFVAISYNGESNSDNLTFYVGTKGTETQPGSFESSTVTADRGSLNWGSSVVKLMFGANSTNGRSLDGWIDNIKFYGSASDATGALDTIAINNIWQTDMTGTPVPEPAVWAWLAGGLALAATALRRRLTR
ncbi:hypothetical protein OpiT1DRAFT_04513 [Opitutaceae bacterium TAV1]|nr:hypothetical protein OpiT1DRAFT_04513 [Opitutaceae bacterium TAV1]